MLSGLFIILLPLVVGYLVPLRQPSALKLINRMLSWIVYVILFFMGISLAFLDNLASNLLAQDLKLDAEDKKAIAALDCNDRLVSPEGLAPEWD